MYRQHYAADVTEKLDGETVNVKVVWQKLTDGHAECPCNTSAAHASSKDLAVTIPVSLRVHRAELLIILDRGRSWSKQQNAEDVDVFLVNPHSFVSEQTDAVLFLV